MKHRKLFWFERTLAIQVNVALCTVLFGFISNLFADRVPDAISRDLVQYICEPQTNGTFRPIGTCFTVGVPATGSLGDNHLFRYVVTAKHVVQKADGSYPGVLVMRANRSTGGVSHIFTPLGETNSILRIYTHPDPGVDLAVIPILTGVQEVRMQLLPAKFIMEKEGLKSFAVHEGDEMFFLGLFTPYEGGLNNIPIFRFGRLSMLADEKIPWGAEPSQELYLMETQVFGGNSGAPVFFYFDERRNPGGVKLMLAGVVKGFFRNWSEIQVVNTKQTSIAPENNGIAAVIPAYYLKEILYSPELTQLRTALGQVLLRGKDIPAANKKP